MSHGYGGRNPYDQRDPAPGGYGAPSDSQGYGHNPYGGGGGYNNNNNNNNTMDGGYAVEMAPLAQNGASVGHTDPNAILNECRDIDRGIESIQRNLEQLRMLQQRTLDDADSSQSSAANRQLDSLSSETMATYRALTERVRQVKSNPDARTPKNSPHIGRVDRNLKSAITSYQQVESQFRKRTQDQMARQYRIVRPDATEDEVRAAVEDTSNGQVFQQAMMQSDRQGRARAALSAVQDRHQALLKIEQQMNELTQLFQDMDTLVVQQEAAVTQIEQKGEEVVDNLDKGNEEIGVAVDTARKTRKKKWICLGIVVAIIAIIAIVLIIYFVVIKKDDGGGNNNNNNQKRTLESEIIPMASRIMGRQLRDVQASGQISQIMRERIHMPVMPPS